MRNIKRYSKKGSVTIEAALIMPMILGVIVILLYSCLLLFYKTYINSLADQTLEKGAAVWISGNLNVDTGARGERVSLYLDDKKSDMNDLCDYFNKRILDLGLMKVTNNVSIKSSDYILYKQLDIKVDSTYNMPLKGLLKMLGFSGTQTQHNDVKLVVNDPVGFTRNLDSLGYAINEIKRHSEKFDKAVSGVDGFLGKLDGIATKWAQFSNKGVKNGK